MTDLLDNFKQKWQAAPVDSDRLRATNRLLTDKFTRSRVIVMQDRLAARIGRYCLLALVLPLLTPMLYRILEFPLSLCIVYAAFGVIMLFLNWWLYRTLNSIDFFRMPVMQALSILARFRRYYMIVRIIGTCIGLPLVAWMITCVYKGDDTSMLWGMYAGFVIGLTIGISKMLRDRAMTRTLIDTLRDHADGPEDAPEESVK